MSSAPPRLGLTGSDAKHAAEINNPTAREALEVAHVAPDHFDPAFATSTYELWSYYAYSIGKNGLPLFNFVTTAFQNLLK
jgi:hypothetical protein